MQDDSPAWQSTWSAVSVGAGPSQDKNGGWIPQRTRQIINLAAGTADTDAVNVAQLKEAMSDARISIHAGEGIIVEKMGTEYTIKANLNGLSNEHGTVHILSNPEEFPDNREQPDASPDQPHPAPRPAPRRVAADQPKVDNGGKLHLGYTANEVKFATDDGHTAQLNDGGTVNVLGGNNIHTASSSTTDANGRTVDNIHIHLNKYIRWTACPSEKRVRILSGEGMDMKGLSITGLAPGEVSATSMDAVNGSQLHATNQMVQENRQNITQLGNSLNKLDARVNRVGAGAAALAALQPLDFDPDDKWDFAAGYGNYAGAHAVAIGAYYRPTEELMFSYINRSCRGGRPGRPPNQRLSVCFAGRRGLRPPTVYAASKSICQIDFLRPLTADKSGCCTSCATPTLFMHPSRPFLRWTGSAGAWPTVLFLSAGCLPLWRRTRTGGSGTAGPEERIFPLPGSGR